MKYTEVRYEENEYLDEMGIHSILFSGYLALCALNNVAWIPMINNALEYIF